MNSQATPTFASLMQEFFTDYMVQQRGLSSRTAASYRDIFVLLLRFAEEERHLPAHGMTTPDLNARVLVDFLDHLEIHRQNCVRSRNVRLAALRPFLKFAARRDPANLGVSENALAVQQHSIAWQGARATIVAVVKEFGAGRARVAALESAVARRFAAAAHTRRTGDD